MSSKKVPDLLKGKIVPSSVQLYGETFHREANLDAWFKELTDRIAELEEVAGAAKALETRVRKTNFGKDGEFQVEMGRLFAVLEKGEPKND